MAKSYTPILANVNKQSGVLSQTAKRPTAVQTKDVSYAHLYDSPKMVQSVLHPNLTPKAAPVLSPDQAARAKVRNSVPTAVQARTGTIIRKPTNVLQDAFDQDENYIDKFKQGNIGGGVANFVETGLTGAQSFYLNALNNIDSLTQGKGLQPFQYQMGFGDYEKSVADRRGVAPMSEQIAQKSPALGTAFRLGMEIGTDPLELTPFGFANDIKLAKGLNQNSQAYANALRIGKLNPPGPTATLPARNTPAPAPKIVPQRIGRGLQAIEPTKPDFYVNPAGMVSSDVGRVEIAGQLPAPASTLNPTRRGLAQAQAQALPTSTTKGKVEPWQMTSKELESQIEKMPRGVFANLPESKSTELKFDSFKDAEKDYYVKAREYGLEPRDAYLLVMHRRLRSGQFSDLASQANIHKQMVQSALSQGESVPQNVLDEYPNLSRQASPAASQSGSTFAGRPQQLRPRQLNQPYLPRSNRETPFTVTPGEMVSPVDAARNKIGQSEMGSQASDMTVQPRNAVRWSVGADTARAEKTIDQLNQEYGTLPKGEQPRAREADIPKKTDYGDVQQHARTLQESAIVDDTLFKDINDAISQGSFTKPTKSNKAAVENANTLLDSEGLDDAFDRFRSVLRSDKQPTSEDIALGNRVLQELQKEGRYGDALDAAIDLSEMLSETGRTLQAARIAKRLSPEGRLMIATRTADKVAKKTGTKVKLSDETVELISKAKTEKEVVEANHKAAVEIWNQVPANWVDKVNSWRYMAMLFNPKTHMRNIVGNALFVPAREFKNLIGTGLERALIRGGERTKAVLNPVKDKALLDFASNDFKNVKSLLKNEGKLDDNVRNLDAKVFNNQVMEGIRKLNLGALDAEDTWFMKFAYDSSLAQYMKANGMKPVNMVGDALEKGRAYAMNEALKATYRDFNSLAKLISRGKAAANSPNATPLARAGGIALEGMIPFAKTPLNLIKRGVGYSPANIVRGIVNMTNGVKSGKVTATEAIDQLASGLSGTAILGLGTALGYMGLVSGKEGEYKDKLYNYNQMLGSQNYSLEIDGKSYTLDWAAPLSMPFFVGVELSKAVKDGNADLWSVLDSMTQISDPMVNMSMLKGINDILTNNFEGVDQTLMDIGTGYAGQFNPTLGGQIARTVDDTRRSTISTNETGLGRAAEKFGRKQVAKFPGMSQKLEPYVDLWGREQKNGNIIENFLNPGYFKQENITPVDRELRSLMKGLDEDSLKKILPTSTAYQYTLQADGEKFRMTEKESTKYQKIRGEESYRGLQKLFASSKYKSMDAAEKVKAIEDIYSDAHDMAKMEILSTKGVSQTVLLSKSQRGKYEQYGKSLGLDEKKFVDLMKNVGSIEGDKLKNGKTIENSTSKKKKAYIDSKFPTATKGQRAFLYEMAGVSQKVGRYRPQFE